MQANDKLRPPKVFYILLIIELCDRVAFYGLQAIAVIYFTHDLGMSETESSSLFASFSALAYAMLVIGGIVGDKILGVRRTYLLGIIVLLCGYGVMSLANSIDMLYVGMGTVIIGNVLAKPSTNNYVGRCFDAHDKRIDAAFTYFYMALNTGIVIASIITPLIYKFFGYHYAMAFCTFSMCIALLLYFIFKKEFQKSDNIVGSNFNSKFTYTVVIGSIIVGVILLSYLLHSHFLSSISLYVGALGSVLAYFIIAARLNSYEAKGMYIAFILWIFSITFFISNIQIATSITLFALHNVDLTFFGFLVPAGITQGLSPLFIVVASPILSSIYLSLYRKGINYNISAKFATGIFLVGLCFLILGFSGNFFSNQNAQISIIWLIIAYAFFAVGELLVSALGASMITQLLPSQLCGFGQGIWYVGAALGMKIGGELFAFFDAPIKSGVDKFALLRTYINLFYKLGFCTLLIAVVLFILVRPLSRAIGQVMLYKKAQTN